MKRFHKLFRFVIATVFVFLQPMTESTCYAESYTLYEKDQAVTMTVQELLAAYEIYSVEVANAKKMCEINCTKYQIYANQEARQSDGIDIIQQEIVNLLEAKTTLKQSLEKLESEYEKCLGSDMKDPLYLNQLLEDMKKTKTQIMELETQIATCQLSITSSSSSLSNTLLEAKLQQFYVDYQNELEQSQINKLKYKFLAAVLSTITMKEQEAYYSCYATNLKTKIEVEKIKQTYGLSLPVNLSSLNLEWNQNDTLCHQLINSQIQIRDYIETETAQNHINLKLYYSTDVKSYNSSNLTMKFLDYNETYLELTNAIKTYQDYIDHTALDSLTEQQLNQTIQSYQLQVSILRKKTEQYVAEAMDNYIICVDKLDEAEDEKENTYEQYRITYELYKKGRATLLDVQEKELQLIKSKCNYYQHIIMKVKLEFILEYYIYGVEYTT